MDICIDLWPNTIHLCFMSFLFFWGVVDVHFSFFFLLRLCTVVDSMLNVISTWNLIFIDKSITSVRIFFSCFDSNESVGLVPCLIPSAEVLCTGILIKCCQASWFRNAWLMRTLSTEPICIVVHGFPFCGSKSGKKLYMLLTVDFVFSFCGKNFSLYGT